MIARRLPIVAALLALVVAGFVVSPRQEHEAASSPAVEAASLGPLATGDGAGTSTWFCAGGSASGRGPAEQRVTLANPTERAAAGSVQLFVEGAVAQSFPVQVAAHDQTTVALATLAPGDWAAALVELDTGGVVATHEVLGVGGWDSDRCSSAASDTWYFPWGQTIPQEASSLRLALFNPFAAEAVVDITFDTDDGFRSPEALQGFLVPARRLVTVDVTDIVPVRQRISTTIKARSGRLVADRIQSLTGIDGTVTLDVTPGAPKAATSWYFADGRVDAATFERIALYNPSEDTASVEVEINRPRAQDIGIEPFELQIPPQAYAEIVLNREGRIPQPLRHSTVVRSLNGVAVVAERVQLSGTVVAAAAAPSAEQSPPAGGAASTTQPPVTTAATAPTAAPPTTVTGAPDALGTLPPGLTALLGSPVVATRWVLPNAASKALASAKVVVLNPSPAQPVTLTVTVVRAGTSSPVALAGGSATLAPHQQLELALTAPAEGAEALLVEGSGPIVVDGVQVYGALADVSVSGAVPLPDGVALPDPLADSAAPPAGPASTAVPAAPTSTAVASPSSTVVATTATTAVAAATTAAPAAPSSTVAVTTTAAPAEAGPATTVRTGT